MTLGLALTAPLAPLAARAADYPQQPIRIIVPYAPGGQADITARLIADPLGARLGQPVTVENRPGANGSIGTAAVARAQPDGHTLALVVSSHVFGKALMPGLPYDPVKDFAPVTLTARTPLVLLAAPGLPAKDVAEFLAYAKAHPGELSFASAGSGSNTHVFGQWLNDLAGLDMAHIPYKGSTPAHVDLVADRVDVTIDSLPATQAYIASGKLRLLAAAGEQRLPQYPEVPTLAEAGVSGFSAASWGALLAPAGTPPAIVAQLNREVVDILRSEKVRERLEGAGMIVVGSTPDALAATLAEEETKFGTLIREMGIRLD
ncbi:tripartite tricarboxylate transporter substrate binding protein [Achromobacter sp. GG226]|nr:tripartite tricarboxylate transporter substrate binding protein [Verticiella sp. GG226]MBU4611453.1 tripartite tricarboxylate transporter substrate binding protein [Verticiella sp. GG226]